MRKTLQADFVEGFDLYTGHQRVSDLCIFVSYSGADEAA